MNKKLTISAKDEKVPFPAAVRGSKTPVLKLSIMARRHIDLVSNWLLFPAWACFVCRGG